jgi:periplasmic divalent cation tolerance protein
MSDAILVLTTVPDEAVGTLIAKTLVGDRLAACVTMSAGSASFYWWEGSINTEEERILFIKTRRNLYDRLEARIKDTHPYTVPEIIAFPIAMGFPAYLDWIKGETEPQSG